MVIASITPRPTGAGPRRADAKPRAERPRPSAPVPTVSPIATPVPTGADYALEQVGNGTRAVRVLLVDDDPMIVDVLQDALDAAGYDMVYASTGRQALALAPTSDLVLLDIGLPDTDGLTVCRALRSLPDLARLPIMILSARGDPADRVRGVQAGADDYLTKPFNLEELLARIEALIRSRQIETGLRERNRQLTALRQLTGELTASVAIDELATRIIDAVPEVFGPESGVLGGVFSTISPATREMRAFGISNVPLARRALEMLGKPLTEFASTYDPPLNLQHEVALTGEPRTGTHLTEFTTPTLSTSLAWAIEHAIGMQGAVAQPAKAYGQTVGVCLFVLDKPVASVTANERTLMSEFSDTIGLALENARRSARPAAPTS